jgi:hypothetical protein
MTATTKPTIVIVIAAARYPEIEVQVHLMAKLPSYRREIGMLPGTQHADTAQHSR